MKIALSLFLAASFSAHALETDNYLVWGRELPDSAEDLNNLIVSQIQDVVQATSPKEEVSCEQITFRIANRFKTTPGVKLFENWTNENIADKLYPGSPYYLGESIYRNTRRFYLSKSGLSPNINVNGIYLGSDKLSHFGSTGRRYLKKYLKKIRKGYSPEEAEKSAIRLGLSNEARILGLWPSGVFSYGDIEANYQGFRFYKKLCLEKEDTYLRNEGGSWKLVKTPDIRDYVSPYWDETFNQSYLAPGTWGHASLIIKKEYCPLRESAEVQTRFDYYRSFNHSSSSLEYVRELQESRYRHAPAPAETQSIDKLCADVI